MSGIVVLSESFVGVVAFEIQIGRRLEQVTASNMGVSCFEMTGIAFRTTPSVGGLSCLVLTLFVIYHSGIKPLQRLELLSIHALHIHTFISMSSALSRKAAFSDDC